MKTFFKYGWLIIFVFACKNKQKAAKENTQSEKTETAKVSVVETKVFDIKRTPCFGTCQVFNMQIYNSGKVVYHGERHVRRLGDYERTITKEELQALIEAFEKANFWNFNDIYTEKVSDMPTVFTTFSHGGKTKTIEDYFNAPAELKSLEALLQKVADEGEWKKISGQ